MLRLFRFHSPYAIPLTKWIFFFSFVIFMYAGSIHLLWSNCKRQWIPQQNTLFYVVHMRRRTTHSILTKRNWGEKSNCIVHWILNALKRINYLFNLAVLRLKLNVIVKCKFHLRFFLFFFFQISICHHVYIYHNIGDDYFFSTFHRQINNFSNMQIIISK